MTTIRRIRPPFLRPTATAAFLLMAAHLAAAEIKVACVGNSITYGYGLNSPYLQSYPTQLDTLLGTGYAVSNFGVSSQTMLKGSNASYWKQSAFTQALALLPDLVVVELGTNDAKDDIWPGLKQNFKPDYISMIDTFRHLSSHPQVWTTLQPPAENAGWRMYDTTIVRQVNPAILEVALQKAAPVIDLHTAMSGHSAWFQSDAVHPNATGAKEMAKIIARHLLHAPATFSQAAGILTASHGQSYQWYRNDTLLSGATAQTYAAKVPGTYRVSVQVDSLGQSRLVSAAQSVTAASGMETATHSPSARSVRIEDGRIVPGDGNGRDFREIQLRNTRGDRVANENLDPGLYLWALRGTNTRGSVFVPR